LLAPRADYVKAVSYAQGGALRSNTPFRVSRDTIEQVIQSTLKPPIMTRIE
jgi:hypothetical protein